MSNDIVAYNRTLLEIEDFMAATKVDYVEKLVTEKGYDVNITELETPDKASKMHFAIMDHNYDMVNMLIRHGIDLTNNEKAYREHFLTMYNCHRVWQVLVNNVNKQDENGNTLMHRRVMENNLDEVKFLVNVGADSNIRNNDNKTAREYYTGNDDALFNVENQSTRFAHSYTRQYS